ncbi:MAG: AAA family ATPase [Bryobacterales bacterium]|nr:AAA family ATPase [Bryobacterales bacterium]
MPRSFDTTIVTWKTGGHLRSIEFPSTLCQNILEQRGGAAPGPADRCQAGGVLFGVKSGRSVKIVSFRALECEHAYGPEFELSPNDEARLREALEENPGVGAPVQTRPVGWYLTKERWSVLTHQDRVIYDRYFSHPWQVTLQVVLGEAGQCLAGFFYRTKDNSIWVTRGEFRMAAHWRGTEAEASRPVTAGTAATAPAGQGSSPALGPVPPEGDPPPLADQELEKPPEPEPTKTSVQTAETRDLPGPAILEVETAHRSLRLAPKADRDPDPLPPYCAFFGFRSEPFAAGGVFWGRQHQRALAELARGIRLRSGVAVLTGRAGTGKTTLLLRLAERLVRESIEFGLILNPGAGSLDFYESLARDLYLSWTRRSREEVLQSLAEFLHDQARRGSTTALLIDNAQDLDREVLEDLRLLDELRDRRGRLAQVVLCGTPDLNGRLGSGDSGWSAHPLAMHLHLRPLAQGETARYIADRMAEAGVDSSSVFPPGVVAEIHRLSGGILHRIDTVCNRLLARCFSFGATTATVDLLEGTDSEPDRPQPAPSLVRSLGRTG